MTVELLIEKWNKANQGCANLNILPIDILSANKDYPMRFFEEEMEKELQEHTTPEFPPIEPLPVSNLTIDSLKLRKSAQRVAQVVTDLNAIVAKHDLATALHHRRVVRIARELAKRMNVNRMQMTTILIAASIHDIGKIMLPKEILNKPGPLTQEERDIVRTHALSGAKISKSVQMTWSVAPIVLQHHERIDGSGYPNELKGDEIRPETKILTVADVIEAMSSDRPYRARLPLSAVWDYLTKWKGIRYDSTVVEAAMDIRDSLRNKILK